MDIIRYPAVSTMPITTLHKGTLYVVLVCLLASLSACGDKVRSKKPGQALASVNGKEVTVLQLNEELQRAGVPASQQDVASKQLLQILIDRALLDEAAEKDKLDRDPKVMQAVERARSMIVAQAYLQKRIGNPTRPTPAEVKDYFAKHPEFFSNRKQFGMDELVIAANDFTPEVRAAADHAKSLEEVAVWLDAHKIKSGRSKVSRSNAEVSQQLSSKLLGLPKDQLFVVKEPQRAMFIVVNEIKDAPVELSVASNQIEQYLVNQKNQELAHAELRRLRAGASIDYLNKSLAPDPRIAGAVALPDTASGTGAGGGVNPVPNTGTSDVSVTDKATLDRGVAGLK